MSGKGEPVDAVLQGVGGGMAGKVITFYSFKGGVGRSTVLATVAWILAGNGRRVLVVDWDIEAPGIHRFFPAASHLDVEQSHGLLNLVVNYVGQLGLASLREDLDQVARRALDDLDLFIVDDLGAKFANGGEVHLLPPGFYDDRYIEKLVDFNWGSLFEHPDGLLRDARLDEAATNEASGGTRSPFLTRFRDLLRERYDYVLVDSRTGLGELPVISAIRMADTLVNCFGLSRQGLDGAEKFARLAWQRKIDVFPVPTRIELSRSGQVEAGRQDYQRRFNKFLPASLAGEEDRYWRRVEIPYHPDWALEERPAPVNPEEDPVVRSCLEVACYVTGLPLKHPEESFDEMDRKMLRERALRARTPAFSHVVVSYANTEAQWAHWLVQEARLLNFSVKRHLVGETADSADEIRTERETRELLETIDSASGGDYCVVPVLSSDYARSPAGLMMIAEAKKGFTTSHGDARLLPVIVHDDEVTPTPFVGEPYDLFGRKVELGGTPLFGLDPQVARFMVEDLLGPAMRVVTMPGESGAETADDNSTGADLAYPGLVPTDVTRLARQRLDYAYRRRDEEEIARNRIQLGQVALPAGEERSKIRKYFREALERASRALADVGGATADGSGADGSGADDLKILVAQASVGLATVQTEEGRTSEALELLAQALRHLDSSSHTSSRQEEAVAARLQALTLAAQIALAGPPEDFQRAWEQLRHLVVDEIPPALSRERATGLLALSRLGQVAPATAVTAGFEADRLDYVLEADQRLRDLDDDGGVAAAQLELALIEEAKGTERGRARAYERLLQAARFLTTAGKDVDVEVRHTVLTRLGKLERLKGDEVKAFEYHSRALDGILDHERRYPDLVIRSYYYLGDLSTGQDSDLYFGRAVSRWTGDPSRVNRSTRVWEPVQTKNPVGALEEYADAVARILPKIRSPEGALAEQFRGASVPTGPSAANDAAIRAVWTKVMLGRTQNEGFETARQWLWGDLLHNQIRQRVRELFPAEADEVLLALGITPDEPAYGGTEPTVAE